MEQSKLKQSEVDNQAKSQNPASPTNWIKVYVVDILPFLSLAVYLLGLVYMEAFYSSFGVNIFDYVGIGPSISAIIEPLLFVAFFCVIFAMSLDANYGPRKKNHSLGKSKKILKSKWKIQLSSWIKKLREKVIENEEKREKNYASNFFYMLRDSISVLFLLFILTIISKYIPEVLLVLHMWPILGLFFITLSFAIFKMVPTKYLKISFFVTYYISLLYFMVILGWYSAQAVSVEKQSFAIEMVNGTKYTDEDYIFISHVGDIDLLMRRCDEEVIFVKSNNVVQSSALSKGLLGRYLDMGRYFYENKNNDWLFSHFGH